MIKSTKRDVYVIGDSISIQYGSYLEKSLRGRFNYDRKGGLAQAIQNLDIPVGANGGDSTMLYSYLQEQDSKGIRYDILLLNCGLHDIKSDTITGIKQVSIEVYKETLKSIIKLTKMMANEVIWIRTTPVDDNIHNSRCEIFHRYNEDVVAYNNAADELMEQMVIRSIDLYEFIMNLDVNLYCDHVHFNEEIRKLQAAFISGYLFGTFI